MHNVGERAGEEIFGSLRPSAFSFSASILATFVLLAPQNPADRQFLAGA